MEYWSKLVGTGVGLIAILSAIARGFYIYCRNHWREETSAMLKEFHLEQEEQRRQRGKWYDKDFSELKSGVTEILTEVKDFRKKVTEHDVEIKNIKDDIKEIREKI
jgi:septal ring factor EnvC (AmiA/AmiB activator)